MKLQHKELANGRWATLSLCEQMANIGSEVSRSLNWRRKGNDLYSKKAVDRALELLCLSIDSNTQSTSFKELTRLKETMIDYFYCENEFKSSETLWRKYFDHFANAVRR